MEGLTKPFCDEVLGRLGELQDDATPKWGVMTAPELVPHLIGTMLYSMGQLPVGKSYGNWFTHKLLAPIALSGIIRPPRNLPTLNKSGERTPGLSAPGDLGTLSDSIDDNCAVASCLLYAVVEAYKLFVPRRFSDAQ